MNDTKWKEIFRAFFNAEYKSIVTFWKTKNRITGDVSEWDSSWSHFGAYPPEYNKVEWLKIKLTDKTRDFVLTTLINIHVPAEVAADEVTIYGYRTDVDYLK